MGMKLSVAKLCVECDEIVHMHEHSCPKCSNPVFFYLSSLVDMRKLWEEIDAVRMRHNAHLGAVEE